eukprot:CAMPEP_0195599104 /NCGR_PEP_ID=MMETSP0815-20121206/3858_1 /TAXON_ID=97485 /ORGANISM="Prymnesium parvum, Strain Texoma1" /LENGTH=148 /DNA_ID=CAMNT_0040738525 /DNA_START=778 /DNA_END=1225 /DNA_ORIENTATION=-
MLITRGGGDGGSSGEGGRCGGLGGDGGRGGFIGFDGGGGGDGGSGGGGDVVEQVGGLVAEGQGTGVEAIASENAYLVGVSPYKACTNFLVEHQSRRTKAWGPFWKLVAVIWGATHRKQKLISWKVISWPPELRQRDAALGLQRSDLIL